MAFLASICDLLPSDPETIIFAPFVAYLEAGAPLDFRATGTGKGFTLRSLARIASTRETLERARFLREIVSRLLPGAQLSKKKISSSWSPSIRPPSMPSACLAATKSPSPRSIFLCALLEEVFALIFSVNWFRKAVDRCPRVLAIAEPSLHQISSRCAV